MYVYVDVYAYNNIPGKTMYASVVVCGGTDDEIDVVVPLGVPSYIGNPPSVHGSRGARIIIDLFECIFIIVYR